MNRWTLLAVLSITCSGKCHYIKPFLLIPPILSVKWKSLTKPNICAMSWMVLNLPLPMSGRSLSRCVCLLNVVQSTILSFEWVIWYLGWSWRLGKTMSTCWMSDMSPQGGCCGLYLVWILQFCNQFIFSIKR